MASHQQQGGANAVSADPENVPSVSEETHAKKASSGGESLSQAGDESPQSLSQDNGSEIEYRTLAWWYVYGIRIRVYTPVDIHRN